MMNRLKSKIKEIFFDDISEKENEKINKLTDELNINNKKIIIKSENNENKLYSISSNELPKGFKKESKGSQENGIKFSK
jgi:hypothetical protein